jgi:hypothetical protein
MRNLTPCLLAAASILTFACNPRLPIHLELPAHQPLPDTTICVILDRNGPFPDNRDPVVHADSPVGQMVYQQTAASIPWSNDRITQYLQTTALRNGANLVIITKNIGTSRGSLGFVAARLFRVANIRDYEKVINWSASRRLEVFDFKDSPPAAESSTPTAHSLDRQSRSDLGFYIYFRPGGLFGKRACHSEAVFRCRSSWINARNADTTKLLIHEQGSFDLCELYRRQLEQQLLAHHRIISPKVIQAIYSQINIAFLATCERYDEDTKYGLDDGRQTFWTHQIAAGSPFTVRILLKEKEQDSAARAVTPVGEQALVYFIRADLLTTVPSSPPVSDTPPCPIGLFGVTANYRIDDGHSVSQPINDAEFSYSLLPAGNQTLTVRSNGVNACRPPEPLQLSLVAGKTYYVKLSVFKRSRAVAPDPELTVMTEEEGKQELAECKLVKYRY